MVEAEALSLVDETINGCALSISFFPFPTQHIRRTETTAPASPPEEEHQKDKEDADNDRNYYRNQVNRSARSK